MLRRDKLLLHLCGTGLILGTLCFAASLTPSLVPRAPWIQGLLGGFCLAFGYGVGVMLREIWRLLKLPVLPNDILIPLQRLTLALCVVAVMLALWWATGWQNRLRALMQMEPIDSAGPFTIAVTALVVFAVLVALARLFKWISGFISRRLLPYLSVPSATALSLILTALLFWNIGNGQIVSGVFRIADASYANLDRLVEEGTAKPAAQNKTGGPGSLIAWDNLGRQGRRLISAGPDAAQIERITGQSALEPLRVYVGLNSADTPQARADLALRELQRIGAFDRANLILATPTGTGWIDPESQSALEYVLQGDVATVAVQYSYLASWLSLLAEPEYGLDTAREVFSTIYGYWSSLPRETRPRLYLHGLSLGAYNSNRSHDLYQVIGDPYQGALWSGPPFNTPTWRSVTADRNTGSPAWLPTYGDGSVVRFTSQTNMLDKAEKPWGPHRIIFLQYASDAIVFFDPLAVWRRPDWMNRPLGPDVFPEIRWIPVVTFLQLTFDMMLAVHPPLGHGHTYAFDNYLDAWASLTDAPWTRDQLEQFKQRVAAEPKAMPGKPASP